MRDIKLIRDNPKAFDEILVRHGLPPCAAQLIKINDDRLYRVGRLQDARDFRSVIKADLKNRADMDLDLIEISEATLVQVNGIVSEFTKINNAKTKELNQALAAIPDTVFTYMTLSK
jgi:seryl-tRNA synthetase